MKLSKAFAAAALILTNTVALASVITVTDSPTGRSTFGGNDMINWTTLGTNLTVVAQPFTISSTGGVQATVSKPTGSFERLDAPAGWYGNFTDGSSLLWTHGSVGGSVTVNFASSINGFGFQINPNYSETTTIVDVFGAGNVLFGTYTVSTTNRSAASADFIGFKSDLSDITKFSVRQNGSNDFAINQISLISSQSNVVPEPTTIALLGLGLLGFAASNRKSAKSKNA